MTSSTPGPTNSYPKLLTEALHPARETIADHAQVLRYLVSAEVLNTDAPQVDEVDSSQGAVVPGGFRTDGTFLWPTAAEYYVGTYSMAPPQELLDRIRIRDYRPPQVTNDEVQAARVVLESGVRQPPPVPHSGAVCSPRATSDPIETTVDGWSP